jgi:hypothetical protein
MVRGATESQVADVHRIEGAAQDAEALHQGSVRERPGTENVV